MPSPPSRRAIVRDGLAVGLATGAYGLSFGAIGVAAGLTVLQTCALSLLAFTGASQFAFVGVVASGGTAFAGALTGLLLGSRNTLYGLRLAPLLQFRGWRRVAGAHIVLDESTAMAIARDTPAHARLAFVSTGVSVFVLWNAATFAGALAGGSFGDPRVYGLDAAVGAAFLALLWPRLRDRGNQVAAALAVGVALSLVAVTPAGVPVLAAGSAAVLVGLVRRSADATQLPGPDDLATGGEAR